MSKVIAPEGTPHKQRRALKREERFVLPESQTNAREGKKNVNELKKGLAVFFEEGRCPFPSAFLSSQVGDRK
jgi:hypothetical protein